MARARAAFPGGFLTRLSLTKRSLFRYEEDVPSRKLTPGEITEVVEKIRKRYDEYVSKFFKPRSLREAFEGRYIHALRARADISSFLLAEISAVEELIKREEERITLGPVRVEGAKGPSHADRILEENRKRIEKYPDVPFHKDAGEEVRRLLGALDTLAQDHWPELAGALRSTGWSMTSLDMLNLDSQLRYLSSMDREEVPQFLGRVVAQLKKFPRNYAAIDREEKEYILEAAFFLNELFSIIERVKRVYTDLPAADIATLDAVLAFVWGVITDFRLKDFKRKKTWDRGE
jgi:hypothetical protein